MTYQTCKISVKKRIADHGGKSKNCHHNAIIQKLAMLVVEKSPTTICHG
jgi:hypothetical protein